MLGRKNPGEVGLDADRLLRREAMLRAHVDSGRASAVASILLRDGAIVSEVYAGSRTVDGDPVTGDSLFALSSASKPLLATLVLQDVEAGRYSLSDPVSELLDWYGPANNGETPVQVHHLLTHTSGYDPEACWERAAEEPADFLPTSWDRLRRRWVHSIASAPPDVPTGSISAYCTQNFDLLGEVVVAANDTELVDLFRDRLFAPLGMTNSTTLLDDRTRPLRVHRLPGDSLAEPPFSLNHVAFLDNQTGGSALFSSAADLAAFVEAWRTGAGGDQHFLYPRTMEAATTSRTKGIASAWKTVSNPESNIGYGWFVDDGTMGNGFPYYELGLRIGHHVHHAGLGASVLWFNREQGLSGVHLETLRRTAADLTPIGWAGARGIAMAYASVEEVR